MPQPEKPHPLIATLLQELDAIRARMDQAPEWSRGGEVAVTAAALAEEVKRLCREASLCSDHHEVEDLLNRSRHRLDELQTLLGVH